ncbi:MAG: hypothetical protein LBU27_09130 [Candidatus Peribacteria bacterium]|jgi:plasmid maintenance system killer protein|nr:hypothetical protein [Candidatus Peribacteria bacterium]
MDIEFMDKKLEDFCDGMHTLKLGRDVQKHLQRKVDLLLSADDINTLRKVRSLNYETYSSGKYK